MRLDISVRALRENLLRISAIGDESTALASELLTIGLDAWIELRTRRSWPGSRAASKETREECRPTLKRRLEAAAAREGLAVHTWLVQRHASIAEPLLAGGSRYRLSG